MNYPQLWRSPGLAVSVLLACLAIPSALAASHTVRGGETLSGIARKYQVSLSSLQKANPRVKPGMITKGQVLNLPGSPKSSATPALVTAKTVVPDATKASAKKTNPKASRSPQSGGLTSSTEADRLPAAKAVKRSPSRTITTYRVKPGETLTGLARRSGVSVGELAEMNGLERTDLHAGQKLVVPASSAPAPTRARATIDPENTVDLTPPASPPPREETPARRAAPSPNPPTTQGTYYHVVKRGDTFSSIARERGVSLKALTNANLAINPNRLALKQKLNIPGVQVASREPLNNLMDQAPPALTSADGLDAGEDSEPEGPGIPAEENAPAAGARVVYRVTTKDSMDSIAREFNTTPKELRQLNQMGTFDRLTADSFITVPWQASLSRN